MHQNITIGFLVPITSKHRNWIRLKESYLIKYFLSSLIKTLNFKHNYRFYLVIDSDDKFFFEANFEDIFILLNIKNFQIIKIINKSIQKGYLTKMWNLAFKQAYNDNCDYFFQCGDDIEFKSRDWIDDSIKVLNENNDIGITGPMDLGRLNIDSEHNPGGQRFIQTQTFVSRKHMEIFGFYFPEEIKNWFCDDWITKIYYPRNFYKLDHFLFNRGGEPRYIVSGEVDDNDPVKKKCDELIRRDKQKIINFIESQNS